MAGIMLHSPLQQNEYLSECDWERFQKQLDRAREICGRLAKEYRLKLFQDSRWPATGIEVKRYLRRRYIRIILNPQYLDNQKEFFELRDHSMVSLFIIYNKLINDRLVATYDCDQINDESRILNDLKRLLNLKM